MSQPLTHRSEYVSEIINLMERVLREQKITEGSVFVAETIVDKIYKEFAGE